MKKLKKEANPKKNKITFVNLAPGIAEMYPIIKSNTLKRDWVEKNAKDLAQFQQDIKKCPIDDVTINTLKYGGHIVRCPGIRKYLNSGYIIPAPWDITIETNGDGVNFKSSTLSPQRNGKPVYAHAVTPHSKEQFNDYTALPLNTLKNVIKIMTLWHILPNPDYVFLVTPPLYNNEPRFSGPVGIQDPLMDVQINIFLYWHVLQGRETIKAGTPIAQYIPIPRDMIEPDIECRTSTWQEENSFIGMANIIQSSQNRDAKKIVEAAKKIFKI